MPAAEAGIKAGDRILKVDGKDVGQLQVGQVVELIRGQAGSRVAIEVERQGETKPLTFALIRKAP
jgi:carboxyl-terminal processing protease